MRALLGAACGAVIAGTVCAEPVKLAETPLGSKRCKVVATTRTDDTGRKLMRSEWHASAWQCQGYRGLSVHIAYGDQREGLGFAAGAARPAAYLWPARFGAWGPTLEWRGEAGAGDRGSAPLVAIARYAWDVGPPGGRPPRDRGAELAVIRVGRDQADTCILAWVDVGANADAIGLARRFADAEAPTRACAAAKEPARLGAAGAGAK